MSDGAKARGWLRLAALFRLFWRRALRWRTQWRPSEEVLHLILAGVVGLMGGLVNAAFYYAIHASQSYFLHDTRDVAEVAQSLGPLARLLMPTVGGLLAGLVLQFGLTAIGKTGTTNMLEAVVAGDGRLRLRNALVKAASSLVSIGTGAPVGREGGIVQLSAVFASKWGQLNRWEPYRLRLLVGCGTAAGLAAAYNAPISGAVFAATVVLGNFSMNLFAPLVVASVVAAVLSRSIFGLEPLYSVPPFEVNSLTQLPWFLLLGVLVGGLAAVFLKSIQRGEELFQRLALPLPAKLTLGGLAVGLMTLAFPEIWGNGYRVTNRILSQEFVVEPAALLHLLELTLVKLLATAIAVGCGMVGGVFTPTLFLGAALGSLCGEALHALELGTAIPAPAFALVGMAGALAGTTRSPLLAMILLFEVSLNSTLIPCLMLGCAVATLVTSRLCKDSVYTAELRRRGLALARESAEAGAGVERMVGDLMRDPVPPLRENTRLADIAARFLTSPNNFLPVVDGDNRLLGMVALQDLKAHLNERTELGIIAQDLLRPAPLLLTPSQSLLDALPAILASELRNIPVVNSRRERRYLGTLVRAEVLGRLAEASAPTTSTETSPAAFVRKQPAE